jgi:hypothetical protein
MSRIIPLTQGMYATVDDEDFEWLSAMGKWTAYACNSDTTIKYYAYKRAPKKDGGKNIGMHRLIANAPYDMEVDHIDGNSLNNFRSNLRLASHTQNQRNIGITRSNKSGYKGVSFDGWSGKFVARIKTGNGYKNLGRFTFAIDAAGEYNRAAIKFHGEFARINNLESIL